MDMSLSLTVRCFYFPLLLAEKRKLANFDEMVYKLDDIAAKLYRHPAPNRGESLELLLTIGSVRQELSMKR